MIKNERQIYWGTVILLILCGVLVYANIFKSDFVFDDKITIVHNLAIRKLNNIQFLWEQFNTRFLTGLSFAANYRIGRLDPFGYHLVNTIIHILASLCVYGFTLLTFQTPVLQKSALANKARTIAFFASMIFLLHPIQTQGVVYITQRATCLATFLYLLSLNLYIKSRLSQKSSFRIAALVATILGMFTKEMTVTIPIMLIVYEWCFFGPFQKKDIKRIKALIPFLLTLAIIPLALLSDYHVDSVLKLRQGINVSQLKFNNVLTEINVLCTYLRLMILPFRQNLDYDYPQSTGPFSLSTFPSIIVLIALFIVAIRLGRREKLFRFCIFWFFITTAVEFSAIALAGQDSIFEHYLYLPMVGFAVFVSSGLLSIVRNKKRAIALLTILVIIYSVLTVRRNTVWQNPIKLWSDAVKKSPNKARPHNNLGLAYSRAGKYKKAIDHYQKAIAINQDFAGAYSNLGIEHGRKGDYDKAIALFKESTRLNPEFAEGYTNLGLAYANKGDHKKAVYYYNRALQLKGNIAQIYINLAAAFSKQGDFNKEIELCKKALKLEPDNVKALSSLGLAYTHKGEYGKALRYLNRSLSIDPKSSLAYNNLGFFYIQQKDYQKAIDAFKKALELYPENTEARKNLNLALEEMQALSKSQ